MAISATFVADFSSFFEAVDQAESKLVSFEDNATKVGRSLDRMTSSFSGTKVIQDAAVMTKAIEDIGGVSKLTDAELKKVGATVDEAVAKMEKMGITVPDSFKQIQRAAENVRPPTEKWTDTIKAATAAFSGFFALEIVQKIAAFTKEIFAAADALTRLEDKTGISVAWLQKFQIAGDEAGVSLDEIGNAATKLEQKIGSGDKSALAVIDQLGLKVEDLKTMSQGELFATMIASLGQVTDQTERTADAVAVFGKTGADMLPLVKRGIDDVRDAFVMSDDTVHKLDEWGDAFGRMWRIGKAVLGEMVVFLGEKIPDALSLFTGSFVSRKMQEAEEVLAAINKQLDVMDAKLAKAPVGLPKDLPKIDIPRPDEVRALDKEVEKSIKTNEDAAKAQKELNKTQEDFRKSIKDTEGVLDPFSTHLRSVFQYQTEAAVDGMGAALREGVARSEIAFRQVEADTEAARALAAKIRAESSADLDASLTQSTIMIVSRLNTLQNEMATKDFMGPMLDKSKEGVQSFGDFLSKELPAATQRAVEGGGNIWAAMFGSLGKYLTDAKTQLGGALSKIFGAGGVMGEALGGIFKTGSMFTNTLQGAAPLMASVGTKMGGVLGSAMQGASIGTMIMPGWGTAIGAGVGLIIGAIKGKPEYQKLGQSIGQEMGVTIPDEMLKAWEGQSKQFGRQATALLHLDEIIAQAGGVMKFGFGKATEEAHNLFSMIDSGALSVQQVGETFDKVFGEMAAVIKPGSLVSDSFRELIRLNDDFGTHAASVAKFVGDQIDTNIIGGLKKFGDQTIVSQNAATALGASVALAFSEAQKQGASMVDLMTSFGPVVDQLSASFAKSGFDGGAAFGQIASYVALASDSIAGPMIDSVNGLGDVLVGLNNIGLLNQETFSGLTEQITGTFDSLVAQGYDGNAAIALMGRTLQHVWELQQDFGLAVDEGTQALLDQASAVGVVGEMHRSIDEQMLKATNRIADAVEGIGKAFGVVPTAAQQAADGINAAMKNVKPVVVPVTYTETNKPSTSGKDLESYQEGTDGYRNFGTGTPVMLHGWEAVVPRDQSTGLAPATADTLTAAPSASGNTAIVINAQGAFFDTPGDIERLADKVNAALTAKYGLRYHQPAA